MQYSLRIYHSNGPPQTFRVEAEGRCSAEVKELTAGRTYEAWVAASTAAGQGAASARAAHTPTHRGTGGTVS